MEEIKKDEDEESRDVEVNNVEWFDPWSKRLAFEKARPLPGIQNSMTTWLTPFTDGSQMSLVAPIVALVVLVALYRFLA